MDLPDPGIEPGSPALQADSLPTELSGKPPVKLKHCLFLPAQGVSGPSSGCVWNPRVFADDARGWQWAERGQRERGAPETPRGRRRGAYVQGS